MGDPPVEQWPELPGVISARPISSVALATPPAPLRPLDLSPLRFRDAVLDLGLVLAVALVVPFGFQLGALVMVGEDEASFPPVELLIATKWFDVLLVTVLAAYFVYRNGVRPAAFGLQLDRFSLQVLWSLPTLAAVYVAMFGTVVVISTMVILIPGLEQDLLHRTKFLEALPIQDFVATVLLLIPVAIHEELLFRGLLIPYLRRVGGSWTVAILISTAIFAILHITQGWLGVLQIFGVGAVFGIFFVLSRSLTAVIIAHFLFNLLQTQLARFLLPWIENLSKNA